MNYSKSLLVFLLVCLFVSKSYAQPCTTLGQTPATAFPVCGTTAFIQQNVPICSSVSLFVPGCSTNSSTNYENKNPYWYKFTCYQSGTLGFTIVPANQADDYDWQLYDVTGLDPNEVYTNRNIIVTGNWSGSSGNTGAAAGGVNYIQCASSPGDNRPRFSAMPTLTVGHDYILLVSHFTDSQSGYSLSFGGGTANITDPLEPHLLNATAPCDGTEIRIKLNKKMKCNSNATNGSDFTVTDPSGNIINPISTIADACAIGFDFDSLSIFLPAPLAPGTYTLKAKKGSDGNTLKDNCDREIPVDEAKQFTVFPLFPTKMDSIVKPSCAPDSLVLIFKKNIKCSSIEPGGSDFFITGPYPVTITAASANCIRGGSNRIVLKLAAPMLVAGNFLVNLKVGSDGNTLLDECDVQTPLPDDVAFIVKDTVNADFNFSINYSCKLNTVNYTHNGANSVNSWIWTFGSSPISNAQNPITTYTNFEPKTTTLIVSNGVCSDTSSQKIVFDNYLKAAFDVTDVICPNKPASFKNNSVGRNLTYEWTFGNGNVTNVKDPAPQTFVPLLSSDYFALPRLIITNDFGCNDTTTRKVQVVYSCFIAVPTAFTPNGDGLNDYLYPLKAYKSSNLTFSVYNRFGQRVFYSTDWQVKWNGKFKDIPQPPGTYVWMLNYLNLETNKQVFEKGTTILIR